MCVKAGAGHTSIPTGKWEIQLLQMLRKLFVLVGQKKIIGAETIAWRIRLFPQIISPSCDKPRDSLIHS